MMKRKVIIVVLVVAAALVCAGIYRMSANSAGKKRQDAPTARVVKRDLGATVQATGIVKPMVGSEVKVGARTPGKVVELPINVGQNVGQGEVIARIEQDDLKARVKLQEAILVESRAEAG